MKSWRCIYSGGLMLAVAAGAWAVNTPSAGAQQKQVPRFVVEPGWPKPGPRNWLTDRLVTEEMGATCTDANGNVVALNRGNMLPIEKSLTLNAAPPIVEFDSSGSVVKAWGDRSVLPEGLHGCLFDHENNFWVGGSGDGIVQKWARDGSKMLMQIGTKGKCDGPDGKCGNPGLNASRTLLNQPADIAIDPANGDIYIADGYGNHRLVVFDRNGQFLRQWGSAGTGPGQFSPPDGGHPHCVVLNRELLYVCDRGNARIQVFDRMGNLKEIIDVKPGSGSFGSSSDLDFSPDNRFMYINDHGNSVLWIYEMATRTIVAGFGRAGHAAGEWTSFHSLAVDRMGNIYTGEVTGRRVQKFVPKGTVPPNRLSTFLDRPHYEAVP
jgi:DNA-binding beta-propeller fold protein YncE